MILRKATEHYLIIFSYIILIIPGISLFLEVTGNNYNFRFNKEKEELHIEYKPKTAVVLLVEILIKAACLGWIFALQWYTFTKKIHL